MEKCGTRLPLGIGARTAIMEHISQRSFIQRRIWAINVRGRSERFLKNLVLTHLHTENTQFDT